MKRLLGLVAIAVTLGACLSPFGARETQRTRYYTLTIPGEPKGGLPGPLRLGQFSVDPAYSSARLAYRTSPYRLDYYVFHRWAADPRHLVAIAMRDYLERFKTDRDGPPIDLAAHLRVIEEDEQESQRRGAIALDVKATRGGKVVLERLYAESEPAASGRPEAVAEAISKSLGRILDQVVEELGR